ncbi:MAG: hypothetical protein ACR2NF_05730 [Pirellulales bacterium]
MSRLAWLKAPRAQEGPEFQRFLDDLLLVVQALELLGQGVLIRAGSSTPESVVAANVGSLFLRTDGGPGTTFYVKESGSSTTGWVGK